MHVLRGALLLIIVALGLALAAQIFLQDPGLVLVRYRGSDYTTSVPYAVMFGLVGLALLWVLLRLLAAPVRALRRRRDRTLRRRLSDGLLAVHEGRFAQGEKVLLAVEDEDARAIARVHAARAAAARGDLGLAQSHLDGLPGDQAALRAVTRAELALAQQRPADALAALDAADAQPLPPRGLALRAQALTELHRSEEAFGMLAALRKADAVPEAELPRLETRWARAMLTEAPDGTALAARWEGLPKPLRTSAPVAAAYAERAAALGWDEAATRAVEDALDHEWDDSLAALYGRLGNGRVPERSQRVERWLQARPDSAGLQLAHARLRYARGDWPGAEAAAHKAVQAGAGSEAWELLGHGYSAAADERRARIAYANALRHGRGDALIELPYAPPAREVRDANGTPRLE